MGTHAKLSPSASKRWLACPGSIRMSEGIPDESSEHARLGTAAHALAEFCLRMDRQATDMIGLYVFESGSITKSLDDKTAEAKAEAHVIDDKMAEGVQIYLDTIRADREEMISVDAFKIEERVSLKWLVGENIFGTADCVLVDEFSGEIKVYDYKNGYSPVEIENNSQLMIYASGAIGKGNPHGITDVEMIVVQPNASHVEGPVRRWQISLGELGEHTNQKLIPGIRATKEPEAPIKSGDHCQFCPALGICPAVRQMAMQSAQLAFNDEILPVDDVIHLPDPKDMTPVQRGKVQDFVSLFGPWFDAAKKDNLEFVKRGGKIPGHKLVSTKRTRSYLNEEDVVATCLRDRGIDPYKEPKLLTPAQAETALKKAGKTPKDAKGIVEKLSVWSEPGKALAPESDKRKAVASSAVDAFKNLEPEDDFLDI